MILLPEGFALPPVSYLVGLLAAAALVGFGLSRRRPAVTDRHILGLAPWMGVGSCLHVLYVIDALPPVVAPLAGTAAVYLTVAITVGTLWLAADRRDRRSPPAALFATGIAALTLVIAAALFVGSARGTLTLGWPAAGFVASIPVTAVVWLVLRRLRPHETAVTGLVGLLVVFGHMLDAVSTTVGVDILGFGERTPLSRWILDAAATLPTAAVIGTGWLFMLVKAILVGVIVVLFADYIEEAPAEGYLLLGVIAAVGLGPGLHNLVLFAVTGGA